MTLPGLISIISASSGLIQIAGTVTVLSASSGTIGLSSQITVTATGPVTITSGLISVTSGSVISTSVILSTGGITQAYIVSTAGAVGPVTSSAGQVTNISSGTVTLSSAPLVLVASSGGTQTIIMSSVQTVTATLGTNPWSSAPGFNVPTVSVSSGLVQISGIPTVLVASSAGLTQTVTVLNASSGVVQVLQNTTPWFVELSTGTAGGTTVVHKTLTTANSPNGLATVAKKLYTILSYTTANAGFLQIFNLTSGNTILGTSLPLLVLPIAVYTTAAALGFDFSLAFYSVRGAAFTTACTLAPTTTTTGSTLVGGKTYVEVEMSP